MDALTRLAAGYSGEHLLVVADHSEDRSRPWLVSLTIGDADKAKAGSGETFEDALRQAEENE